jgi:hypothetical protein
MTQTHIGTTSEFNNNKKIAALVKKTLLEYCINTNVEYTTISNIKNTRKSFLVTILIHDLIFPDSHLDSIDQWLGENNRKLLICTDNWVTKEKFANIQILFHPALVGLNYLHVDPTCYQDTQYNQPTKLYNCFIHRSESVRQSWLYFLHQRNLLDSGYVSYLCFSTNNFSKLHGLELYDYIHNNYQLNNLSHFEKAYQELRPQIPFQNFVENGTLQDKILDSRYSLVLDTYATDDDVNKWFISEKVYRALMLPSLHLIFVQTGTLAKLDTLGVKIDQSNLDFDHLEWIPKQQKILDILVQNSQIYDFNYLKDRALHNYYLIKSMFDLNIDQFYPQVIDLAQSQFH